MWEISITIKPKFRHYLVDLKKNLTKKFNKSDFICVCEKVENEYVLSVAVIKNIEKIKNYMKKLLLEIIVLTCKEEFLLKNISMKGVSETCKTAFIKALLYYDFENDVDFVENKLNINSNVNIDAFGKFRCGELNKKWLELIDTASYNSLGCNNHEIFLEFLRFLSESIKPALKEVNVYFRNNNFIMIDENGCIVSNNASKFYKDEFSLVTDLIMLAPEKINFYCENLSKETKNLVFYIFGERVSKLV